ncbi:hypothetical protein ACA910_022037 [Epithemia clementina (nom. ined.)]
MKEQPPTSSPSPSPLLSSHNSGHCDSLQHTDTYTLPAATPSFLSSLIAGGVAGTTVDVTLYPIDTIKTRLQAPGGFWKAGGFRGIYQGLGAVALGSAPGAALFFSTYEQSKQVLAAGYYSSSSSSSSVSTAEAPKLNDATIHMTAASAGELMACLVRVPTEVIKGRMQTASSPEKLSICETIFTVWHEPLTGKASSQSKPAGLAGLYRGFGITLFREIPFAMIQFPLYERAKIWWSDKFNDGKRTPPVVAAGCGSLSGAVAGAVTTPLDVLKTRYMLGQDANNYRYKGVFDVLQRTLQNEGALALLHGIQARVFWISLGGFVFFGAYESSLSLVRPIFI